MSVTKKSRVHVNAAFWYALSLPKIFIKMIEKINSNVWWDQDLNWQSSVSQTIVLLLWDMGFFLMLTIQNQRILFFMKIFGIWTGIQKCRIDLGETYSNHINRKVDLKLESLGTHFIPNDDIKNMFWISVTFKQTRKKKEERKQKR